MGRTMTVRRLLVLPCLCAALLPGLACKGEEKTAADMPRLTAGEAKNVAGAKEIELLDRYHNLDEPSRLSFFKTLVRNFGPDREKLSQAIETWRAQPTDLGDRLVEQGLSPSTDPPKLVGMTCPTAPPAEPSIEVRRVETLDDYLAVMEVDWAAGNVPAAELEERRARERAQDGGQ